MPTETKIEPTSFLEKCYIYWKTRNYGRRIEQVSLLLPVAIYMNKKIFEEELESSSKYLMGILNDKDDVENIMKYVKMKLGSYQENNELWLKDRQEAFNLIIKNQELYAFVKDIFYSDDSFDEDEELFEEVLKRIL